MSDVRIADTVAPKSDQLDYDDFLIGPRTFTVTEVRRGPSADQPVEVALKEFDRPWRPAKSMRRVLIAAWGPDASEYIGRRVTLFGDSTVKFGGIEVGGIRVSHLSHIDKTLTIALTATRGKRKPTIVRPLDTEEQQVAVSLTDDVATEWVDAINATSSLTELHELWRDAGVQGATKDQRVIAAKDARKTELGANS